MAPPSFADQAPAIVHENLQHMVGERVRVVFFDDPTSSSDEKLDGRLGEVMAVGSVERCAEAIESGTERAYMARFPFSELPPLLRGAHFFIPEFVGLGPPWGYHLSQLHSPRLNQQS